jgi:HAE1 family hydrophobic/amphiphilic exporter-1
MWLTRLSILRPVTITMLVVAILVLGLRSLVSIPVELYPNIELPFVSITTVYPGAGPQEVETLVTKPIEDAISLISGVKNVTSTSQEGVSSVGVEFYLGTNLDVAATDVREKIDAIRSQLPRDVAAPVILKVDIAAIPVLSFGISSPRPPQEIRRVADDIIKDRLSKVAGVAAVGIAGGEVREILVAVDRGRLDAYNLSIGQVNQALQTANLNLPSGRVTEGRREYAIRAVGEFHSVDEIRNLRLPTADGSAIYLHDVADVRDTVAERQNFTRLNGQDSVTATVIKQADANTLGVVDGAKRELTKLTGQDFSEKSFWQKLFSRGPTRAPGELPPDIKVNISMDQSKQVRDTISEVEMSLILGALLAVLIVFLFLHNLRGTIIVAIAIPTSIIAAFTPMFFAGFTLNMMTLLALSLSVGILVDDSIVVMENIWRHLRRGEPPREAALNGRTEIGLAAITITSVDVVVFVPIAFMGGIIGQFFRQFGITIVIATLFSLFVSFTLTPMLSSRWFRTEDMAESAGRIGRAFAAFDRFYDGLDRRYRTLLAWTLDHRRTTVLLGFVILLAVIGIAAPSVRLPIAVAVALLTLFGWLLTRRERTRALGYVGAAMTVLTVLSPFALGGEFFPPMDEGTFTVNVEMPARASLEATTAVTDRLEVFLLNRDRFPEIESIFGTIGASSSELAFGGAQRRANYAQLRVVLIAKDLRRRSDRDLMREVESFGRTLPDAKVTSQASAMGPGGTAIQAELTGSDTDQLVALAERIAARVKTVPGTKDVDISWEVGKPELQARIDRERTAQFGLTTAQVASALRTSIEGATDTKYREGDTEYDIRVRLREPDRRDLQQVGDVLVASNAGGPIRLKDVAAVSLTSGPTKIDRKNRQRMVAVSSDLQEGYRQVAVQQAISRAIRDIPLGNVNLHWGGESEQLGESGRDMMAALLLSIVLIYILMAALFEGYLSPFIIMFSLPMALAGAVLALLVTNSSLNVISGIGIIMLMGLVTKNAILLVDYTNTLRGRGLERREAILEAGPTRLRPILMTTMAMVFGMLPTAAPHVFRLVRGAEFRAPLAIAVIGGLLLSLALTLLIIPVLYTVFDDLGTRFSERLRRLARRLVP